MRKDYLIQQSKQTRDPELQKLIEQMKPSDEKEEGIYIFECKRCGEKKTIKKNSQEHKNNFCRCKKCGYVIGPFVHSAPGWNYYIVEDGANPVEPKKWFGSEEHAKAYVKFSGLSEDQIKRYPCGLI